jgi:hypothetical protein
MAEISTVSKKTRPYQRPPLLVPIPAGAALHERLELPRYEPPKPKKQEIRPKQAAQPPEQPSQLRPISVQPPIKLAQRPRLPSLSELFATHPDLPAQNAILGVCEDQLPMLLDLHDPSPGSVLVVGDERQQQLDLLRMVVMSVVLRNSPRGVQFIVFSHLPDAWWDWVEEQGFDRYCLGVLGVDTPEAMDWIQQLTDWTEQRRTGQRTGPPVILLLDTLNFIPKLALDLRLNFELLVQEGPQARIWPIAAISTALANSLARQVNIFQTLVYGYTEETSFYIKKAGLKEAEAKGFGQPGEFAVKIGSDEGEFWLKFRVPSQS